MEQAAGRAKRRVFVGSGRRGGQAGFPAHLRPAVAAGVDVLKLETAALEVLAEADVAECAKLGAALAPRAGDRGADAAEHDLPCHRVEVEAAARRQKRKVVANLPLEVCVRAAQEGAQASVEPELLPMCADEVEDRACTLPGGLAETAAQLL